MDRLLEVQSRIAWEVAREVRIGLAPEDRLALERGPTDDPRAFDHFLRGNHEPAGARPRA